MAMQKGREGKQFYSANLILKKSFPLIAIADEMMLFLQGLDFPELGHLEVLISMQLNSNCCQHVSPPQQSMNYTH
jgi:hypothetical protein